MHFVLYGYGEKFLHEQIIFLVICITFKDYNRIKTNKVQSAPAQKKTKNKQKKKKKKKQKKKKKKKKKKKRQQTNKKQNKKKNSPKDIINVMIRCR